MTRFRPLLAALTGLLACGAPSARPSGPAPVVLVSLDTLRADRLGAWGNPDGLTPNLDRFAAEATIFTAAYAQANETCFSHASLFTSRYPSEIGRLDPGFHLPASLPTMATMLQANGYATGAAVGGAYLSPAFGFDQGFDHYDPTLDWGTLHHTVPSALRWLDGVGDAPFFLFLHGYDAHSRYLKPTPFGYLHADVAHEGPAQEAARDPNGTLLVAAGLYTPGRMPLEYLSRTRARFSMDEVPAAIAAIGGQPVPLGEEGLEHLRGTYDGAVTYADAWFGRFMAALGARGLLERAWIVVLSDHGEDLGEHGTFNHRFSLAEDIARVPLMIRPPGGGAALRVASPVELLDVLPTVAEIAGATPPAGIRGRSLLPAARGGAAPERTYAFTEGSFRMVAATDGRGRLTFSGVAPDDPWLPDLLAATRVEGPGYSAEGTADRTALRDALVAWRRSVVPARGDGVEVPAALRDSLRARGYWEAGP